MNAKKLTDYLSIHPHLKVELSQKASTIVEKTPDFELRNNSIGPIVHLAYQLSLHDSNDLAIKLLSGLKLHLIRNEDYTAICRLCDQITDTLQELLAQDANFSILIGLDQANSLLKLGEFDASLAISLDLLSRLTKVDNKKIEIAVLSNISSCFFEVGDTKTCEEYLNRAVRIADSDKLDSSQHASLFLNAALIKIRAGKLRRAAMFLNKCSIFLPSMKESELELRYWFVSSKLAYTKGDIESSFDMLKQMPVDILIPTSTTKIEILLFNAQLLVELGEVSESADLLETIEALLRNTQCPEYHLDYLKLLAEVREKQEEYKEALELQKMIREIEKERFSGLDVGELHELRRKHDVRALKKESFRIKHQNNRMLMSLVRQRSMLSTVAHDLKSPLSGLSNLAYYTSEMTEQKHTEKRNKYLNLISDTTKHLSDSVENLLGTRAMETGTVSVDPKFCECGPLMEYAKELYGVMAEKKNITLVQRGTLDACHIYADKSPLLEAVGNLVSNAIRYTQEGGTVEIISSIDEENATATISVRDNGPGIPEAIRENMYQKFARMSSQHDSSKVSLGLGLWVVSEIAKNMKAQLTCESQEGIGTTFSITMKARLLEVAV